MSTDTACIGQTVTFTDATVLSPNGAPISSWNWDFGDGNVVATGNPSITHSYISAGIFPVSVTVTDTNGCQGSIVQNIVVISNPIPSFSATPTFSCTPPLNVTFTNTSSTIGPTTYLWNFGDATTSTLQNPSHTYTASGTYNVTLIVNQNGCIDSLVMPGYITIQNIAASFIASPTTICSGDTVTFTNTSSPPAVSANWNFGDATTSTQINPTHTYTSAGTYTVTMTATDANSCTGTSTSVIIVNQTPTASFTADTTSACSVPFTVNFTNTSTGGATYLWDFGDGSPTSTLLNPTHTYTASWSYNVTLIVFNANSTCSDTVVMNAFIVISPPLASFLASPDSGCVPLTVNFTSTSTSAVDPIATYIWDFGDGNTTTTASPLTSNTYTATGVYSVMLIIQTVNGCADTFICNNCIRVGTTPVADFGVIPDTVCVDILVGFYDSSTVSPGNITGWYWNFGDGGFSTLQNPGHAYSDTGTYQIYLVAYNNGCADTSLFQNVVVQLPRAEFTYSLSCTNYYTVTFISTSIGADSVFWDFGDGTQDSSNTINPVHTYPSRGPFTVTLFAFNYTTGCIHTLSATFTIAEPIAYFTVSDSMGCYPFAVSFSDSSQDANSVLWDFGDPSSITDTSTFLNPNYTYSNTGQYITTLIITDVNGCKDTIVDTLLSLGPYPFFFADTLTGCRPLTVTFTDTSVSDSVLVQWTWDFGDASPIVITNVDSVVHTYLDTGLYSVTMTVRDTNGCLKTIVKNYYIQPTFPYPSFTVDTFACKNDVLTFDASATSVIGGTYIWNYGDGNSDTTTSNTITHSYISDGYYLVTLTVSDTNGCDSTITDSVLILKPTANFNWTDTNYCGYTAVSFIDSSSGYVTSWYWMFGDGGTSTTADSADHNYTLPGVYTVTLIVTNGGGCKDTIVKDSIIVTEWPSGDFTFIPNTGCNPLTVCFDANSPNSEYYIWDFGDGTLVQTLSDTICHTYTSQNIFTPVLAMGNTLPSGDPCLISDTSGTINVTNIINVSLNTPPSITLPYDSILTVTATYSGGTPPYTFLWTPSTGISCTTCQSVYVIGTGDSILYLLTIYDASGCVGMASLWIFSEPCSFPEKFIPNVFSPNDDGVNDIFFIPGICPDEKFFLQIFDRWGVLLFASNQRKNGWDGRTSSGLEAKEGVYYFVITINEEIYKGFLHLMR